MPTEIAQGAAAPASRAPGNGRAAAVVALGWFLPGMGYFIQRKWIRGGLVLISVVGMFLLGLALSGQLYGFNTGDILDMLGFVGDICAGALYFISRSLGAGAGNPFVVMGDYGTKFLIAAGLLNLLAAVDARDILLGRKS